MTNDNYLKPLTDTFMQTMQGMAAPIKDTVTEGYDAASRVAPYTNPLTQIASRIPGSPVKQPVKPTVKDFVKAIKLGFAGAGTVLAPAAVAAGAPIGVATQLGINAIKGQPMNQDLAAAGGNGMVSSAVLAPTAMMAGTFLNNLMGKSGGAAPANPSVQPSAPVTAAPASEANLAGQNFINGGGEPQTQFPTQSISDMKMPSTPEEARNAFADLWREKMNVSSDLAGMRHMNPGLADKFEAQYTPMVQAINSKMQQLGFDPATGRLLSAMRGVVGK